jgi:hypothetical protein
MRLLAAVALGSLLVPALNTADIERALALARARESERQQFHQHYIFDLKDAVITQIEVTTEFRRLELIAEEHVLRGDWMFTRSVRAAQEAIATTRGLVLLRAQVRLNPLNTFIESPPYGLAIGAASGGPLEAIETKITPQFSAPYKTRDLKTLTALVGATIEATIAASRIGQNPRAIAVTLERTELTRVVVDFARLD